MSRKTERILTYICGVGVAFSAGLNIDKEPLSTLPIAALAIILFGIAVAVDKDEK
ncbi:hypothetical protein [Bacillus glycinifermentans]|uniref:hypothetical protein n=1 Tax=Bacillus glycinifermentans TaxID=1664069 RepID=UPI0013E8DCFD|nr:hypothetical protein [Bacillus glycinifermentans]